MKIPNHKNDPDYNWDEILPCGHTPRFHKEEIDTKLNAIFGLSIDDFNEFSKFMHETVGIQLEFIIAQSQEEAMELIMSKAPNEVKADFVEGFIKVLEVTIKDYHKDKTFETAQKIVFIMQKIEKVLKWSLKQFRHDLWIEINQIMIYHWKEFFGDKKI